ncbi:hypothetical protein DNL40_04955 [Xylanimonas oleitrophica]|uniref:Beta-xylanase n=1 Tax=Xylanimonas oleitrophica TaxID=2607479 RepID=A0A2W5Y7D5_9MICO|nr:endo-1,4-beta-xylanase [Xylanimonas oleitrophica]PZR54264.1 hypothetical protein DNL40_04955 [Xylanimonas oleitrophica]
MTMDAVHEVRHGGVRRVGGWRRAVAGVATAVLTASGAAAATTASAATAAETVVSAVDFEDGTTGAWTPSGGATLAVVESPDGADDGQVLSITRAADYEGIQSPAGIYEAGATYSFTMRARLGAGVEGSAGVRFVAKPQYTWIGDTAVTADAWTTVSGTWTAPAADAVDPAELQVYLGTEDREGPYEVLVDDVVVTLTGAPGGPGGGGTPGDVVVDTDFEDGTAQGWTARETREPGTEVAVVEGGAAGTAHALQVSGRDNQGDGPQIDVTDRVEPGVTYRFSAWLRFADGQEPGDLTLSSRTVTGGTETFSNLLQLTGVGTGWTQVAGEFTVPGFDTAAELYVETRWASGEAGNVSTFLLDEVRVEVPAPPVVQDLVPLRDTVDFPLGVAIDSRETSGAASELLLRHFGQVTGENHMKVEAWYDAQQRFQRHAEATALLDYAQANDLRLYGHVLVWHSQSPEWFFEREDGTALTSSEADKAFMRERLRTHVFDVARSIAEDYGPYGSDTNPLVAWDVVNEVVSDANEPGDGLRRSAWYSILGEEYIHLAFRYADEAFNEVYAAEGTDRPVALFINDYNTEQGAKQDRYRALVERLLAAGVPVDGVGHQFHVSLTTPVSSLTVALDRFADLPVVQAVTELDVTVGTPVTEANLVAQGHYYRDAFDVFRDFHARTGDMYSVTVWGLTDNRSWRSTQAPLLFDGALQAKYAYYGAAGLDEGVPPLVTGANVFAGDVALEPAAAADAVEWRNLPAQALTESAGSFVPRWSDDHLTLLVTVASPSSDVVEVEYDGETYRLARDGSGDVPGLVLDAAGGAGGWRAVLHVPHEGPAVGDERQLDVRVLAGGSVVGAWNSPGETGTLTYLEELSTLEVVQAAAAPAVDGVVDDVWADAQVVTTGKTVEGAADGASAEVRTLWEGEHTLYVLFEVTDPVIDVSSGDPWNQDSVELFLDLGNAKAGGFGPNDAQMRISADNVRSFGTGDVARQAARLTSATARTDTGYVVELAVDLRGQSGGQSDVPFGGLDTFQGLDFQVNDGRDGARYSVRTWAEPTGTGYQSTARWGVGHLVAAPEGPQEPEQPAHPEWERGTVYVAGDRVLHGGSVYEAQWWVLGEVPGASPWGSWMQLGEEVTTPRGAVRSWTPSWVYTGGQTVAHEGHLWKAKWWTRNQVPGDRWGPWEDLGAY